MQILPLSARGDSPYFRMGITLDYGVPFIFDFRWNTRGSAWYMSVFEDDGTPIASSLRVVLGMYLGRRVLHPLFRRGVFVAVDLSGQGLDAGLDDLGSRIQVRRYLAQEVIQGRYP